MLHEKSLPWRRDCKIKDNSSVQMSSIPRCSHDTNYKTIRYSLYARINFACKMWLGRPFKTWIIRTAIVDLVPSIIMAPKSVVPDQHCVQRKSRKYYSICSRYLKENYSARRRLMQHDRQANWHVLNWRLTTNTRKLRAVDINWGKINWTWDGHPRLIQASKHQLPALYAAARPP